MLHSSSVQSTTPLSENPYGLQISVNSTGEERVEAEIRVKESSGLLATVVLGQTIQGKTAEGLPFQAAFKQVAPLDVDLNWKLVITISDQGTEQAFHADNIAEVLSKKLKTGGATDFTQAPHSNYSGGSDALTLVQVGGRMSIAPAQVNLPERSRWDADLKPPQRPAER